MRKKLTEPFGKAGLTVAILALVLAMVGGAYAAGGLTKSQEKQVTKIAKKYAGKPGATGAAGANGTNGTNGTPGAPGKEGAAGKEGSPWTAGGTLPSGQTETGAWSAGKYTSENIAAFVPISFPIPLAKALGETKVHYIKQEEVAPAGCTGGSFKHPIAEKENLCIYVTTESEAGEEFIEKEIRNPEIFAFTPGAGKTGAVIYAEAKASGQAYGTWALTAP